MHIMRVHSQPAGPTVVPHGGAVPPSWKRLYSIQWKRMRRVARRLNVDQKNVWHILHNQQPTPVPYPIRPEDVVP